MIMRDHGDGHALCRSHRTWTRRQYRHWKPIGRMSTESEQSVSFAMVVRDEPRSVKAAVRTPQRTLDPSGTSLYATDENGGVRQLLGRV